RSGWRRRLRGLPGRPGGRGRRSAVLEACRRCSRSIARLEGLGRRMRQLLAGPFESREAAGEGAHPALITDWLSNDSTSCPRNLDHPGFGLPDTGPEMTPGPPRSSSSRPWIAPRAVLVGARPRRVSFLSPALPMMHRLMSARRTLAPALLLALGAPAVAAQ